MSMPEHSPILNPDKWWRVAPLSSLPENRGFRFSADGVEVAIFRLEDKVLAIDDYCPHMGDSLSAGQVEEGVVICPRHLWGFRLTDGQCVDVATLRARTYRVMVHDGWVYVEKPSSASDGVTQRGAP